MEINETIILDDRGFVKINGHEAKSFLQNIVTNDNEKIRYYKSDKTITK